MKKKIAIIMLVLAMSIFNINISDNLYAAVTESTNEVIANGICGDNATWELNDNYTLTISGTGDIYDYFDVWKINYQHLLKKIIINEGITRIGKNCFTNCYFIEEVTIADSVTSIGELCFSNTRLKSVKYPLNLKKIERGAFSNCGHLTAVIIPASIITIDCEENIHDGIRNVKVFGDKNSYAEVYAKENELEFVEYITSIELLDIEIDNKFSYKYNGYEIKPTLKVTNDVYVLQENIQYSLSYENNIYPGIASVTITGIGEYSGSVKRVFSISRDKLQCTLEPLIVDYSESYSFRLSEPIITSESSPDYQVYYSTEEQLNSENYLTSGSQNIPSRLETGTTCIYYYVHTDSIYCDDTFGETYIAIKPRCDVNDYVGTYDGNNHTPSIDCSPGTTLYYSTSKALTFENYLTDGTVACPQRKDVGTTNVYYIAVPDNDATAESVVVGSTKITINERTTGQKLNIGDCVVNIEPEVIYTGFPIKTNVTVSYQGNLMVEDIDYTLEYSDNTKVGIAHVLITGIGNYEGTLERSFIIKEKDDETKKISDCTITLSEENFYYNGKIQVPSISVIDGNYVLKENQYTCSFGDSINVGTYSIIIEGNENVVGGNRYTGSKTITYNILPTEALLKFEMNEVTKDITDEPFVNKLEAKTEGRITYASSNTNVATVDSDIGMVSIVGPGTTDITVKSEKCNNYLEGESTYILIVNQPIEEIKDLELEDLSYSFGNVASSFGYPEKYNYPLSAYQMIFGKTTKAAFWFDRDKDITGGVWRGNCAGFSGTAALLADSTSGISVQDFDVNASEIGHLSSKSESKIHDISVTQFIEAMQISQHTQLFNNSITKNRIYTSKHLNKKLKNLNGLYEVLVSETEAGRPVILGLYQSGAHAILAYDVKDISDTESQVYIYDSNWPNEERIMTLRKDSSGNYMQWSYEIGGSYGVWGTDNKSSSISYVPYSIVKEIWETKGNLVENENVLSLNSGSVAIYASGDKPVATVTQGELSTTLDDIQVINYLALETAESDTLLLSLPVDVYTFQNLDKSVEEFEVAVANNNLGAKASTTAESVTIAVDDSCNLNAVYIDASEEDTYSITLNSSFVFDEDNVVVAGKGNGETMEVSQTKGNININNCQITSITIDGKEINNFQITASAGKGGTITPYGSTVVTKGESIKYDITPYEGYIVSNVYVDGKSIGAVETYEFMDVDAHHEIYVEFKVDLTTQKTTVTLSKSTYSSATLKWNAISGAEKYQIYYSTKKSSGYKKYGTYDGDKATVSGLKTGTTYYFRVRAVDFVDDHNIYSKFSNVVSVKPSLAKPTNLYVAKNTYSSVKVTWEGVSGGSYYELWRKQGETGTWKKLKTYSKDVREAIVTGLKTGKKYYFRVRARRYSGDDSVYSSYSNIDFAVPALKKTTITVTKKSSSSVKVSWKAVSGATGYQIYQATGSQSYKKIKTVSSKYKYQTVGSLKKGKTYGFKVRAYRVVDGKYVYSSFSSIVKKKM